MNRRQQETRIKNQKGPFSWVSKVIELLIRILEFNIQLGFWGFGGTPKQAIANGYQ